MTIANSSLTRSLSWLFVEKIILMLMLFFTNIILMRFLGPSTYGELAFYQIIISIALVLGDFGFRRVYLSQTNKTLAFNLIPIIFKYKVLISFLTSVLIVLLVFVIELNNTFLLLTILLILSPFEVYGYYYEARLNHGKLVKIRLAILFILSLMRVLLCVYNFNLVWIVLTYIIHMPISNLISYYFFKLEVDKTEYKTIEFESRAKQVILKSIKYRAVFFWLSFIIVQLHVRADQFSVKFLMDYEALGFYVAAYKFVEQLVSLATILSNVILPHVSSKKKGEHADYLKNMYKVGFVVSIPLSIVVYFSSELIVSMFLGNAYQDSIVVLKTLSIALPFLFISNLGGVYYSINKLEKYAFIRNLLSLLVSVFVCLLLIPGFGIAGAAVSTVISYFFMAFLIECLLPACRRNLHLKICALKDIVKSMVFLLFTKRKIIK